MTGPMMRNVLSTQTIFILCWTYKQKKKDIQHSYSYRQLTRNVKTPVYSQKVTFPPHFSSYIMKPPKTFLGTNSSDIKVLLATAQARQEPPTIYTNKDSSQKKPKLYMDIEKLLQIMKYYKTSDKIQILKQANEMKDKVNIEIMTTVNRSNQWNVIYRKSQEEFDLTTFIRSPTNYKTTFVQDVNDSRQNTMARHQTTKFMMMWTAEQAINLMTIILQIYSILRKYHPKINTLYLQGSSNAGKTYVLGRVGPPQGQSRKPHIQPVLLFPGMRNPTNNCHQWAHLRNQQEAELYKNILCETTYINIKNKSAEILYRKPVLITPSQPIWRFVTNERDPLMNKMIAYQNLGTSTVIKRFTTLGAPSTEF